MSIIKRARWKDPSGKVTDYDLGANAANVSQDSTHRFVSDTEKNNWNAKLGSTGDGSNLISKFTQASSRTNLVSGEKDSASKGKIMKFFADLKAVAFSGSYNDLSNKPSIHSLANNCTTTAAGYGLDARQGKVLMDKANQLSSELLSYSSGNYALTDGTWGTLNSQWISDGRLYVEKRWKLVAINGTIRTKQDIPDGSRYAIFHPNGHFDPFVLATLNVSFLMNQTINSNGVWVERNSAEDASLVLCNNSGSTILANSYLQIFGMILG